MVAEALDGGMGRGLASFRALSGRLEFTVRRHKFNKDSLSLQEFNAVKAPSILQQYLWKGIPWMLAGDRVHSTSPLTRSQARDFFDYKTSMITDEDPLRALLFY